MAVIKTCANDADRLAHLVEVGFYREVRVKGFDSMLTRTLVAARTRLVRVKIGLSNQIRGIMKTFGLVVPTGKGSTFEANVRDLLADYTELPSILLALSRSSGTCACELPNSFDNLSPIPAKAKHASYRCRSPVSAL